MFNITGIAVDQYDDPSFFQDEDLYKAAVAASALPEDVERLPDSGFALKIAGRTRLHRKYPIHNKVATMLSLMAFEKNAHHLPEDIITHAAYYLKEACSRYGIEHDLTKVAVDEAAPILDYHLIRTDPKLSREALVYDLQQKVANYIEDFDLTEPRDRVKIASELKILADALDEKLADARVTDYIPAKRVGPLFKLALSQRETKLLGDAKTAEAQELRKLFKGDESAEEVAELLSAFDKTAELNITKSSIIDPYKAAFGGTYKTAETFNTHTTWDYLMHSLAHNNDLLNDNFSADFIDAFQRAPQLTYDRSSPAVQKKIKDLMDKVVEKPEAEETRPGAYSS